ncbi:TetR/AcrR family transcriptional regulator [Nocardia panacis]|uniref:TetR/AcrR family transcriptional regulator n=1 Tax=Nocardia panacis TaxID=2340916 RepID=A0A3A4KH77_9NOCA|nr:TetR/AcrR family transcriptional regulator [Nocardia panacis]RJO68295.1 TetR/AcrR family transcriptional regulator [Nocardia panacis]
MSQSRKERSAETEQALKAAARRLFAERGYLNTKITDITAAAGRAAGSFYNHFTGKEQLLQELLDDIAAEGDLSAETAAHNPDFTDPAAVRLHIEQFWLAARKHWAVYRSIQQAALVDDEFARRAGEFAVRQRRDILDHLDGFGAEGPTLPAAPEVALAMMFGLTQSLLQAVEEGALELTDEQAVDALTRFVYRGLSGRDF